MKYPPYRINHKNSLCDQAPMADISPCEVRENRIQEITYEKVGDKFKVTYIAKDGTEWWRMMSKKEVEQTKYNL